MLKWTKIEANKDIICNFSKLSIAYSNCSNSGINTFQFSPSNNLASVKFKQISASSWINSLIISTFVNDIKIMGPRWRIMIERVKRDLSATFAIIEMGPISFYLSLKVNWDHEIKIIKLSQLVYIDKILKNSTFIKPIWQTR